MPTMRQHVSTVLRAKDKVTRTREHMVTAKKLWRLSREDYSKALKKAVDFGIEKGLTYREISEALGISIAHAHAVHHDE